MLTVEKCERIEKLRACVFRLKKEELEKAIKLAKSIGTPLDHMYCEVVKAWVIVVGVPYIHKGDD